jgi:dihydroxy-acid dehydratase
VPLLVNLQPAGTYLGEDFHQAGGVPAVVGQLMQHGLIHEGTLTVNGQSLADNCRDVETILPDVIRPIEAPLLENAGFLVMTGNLFESAVMKTSVIAAEFRDRYLTNPDDPNAFEGPAVVFDGPEDYHRRIDDERTGITEHSILFMRGSGPIGHPGAAEVVNMRPPAHLIEQGVLALACIGDGRQSGTSGSPSILNASPEAAAGGNLAILETGDRVRVDLNTGRVDVLLDEAVLRERRAVLTAAGGYQYPASQTPWQEMQRGMVGQLQTGAVLEPAVKYHRIVDRFGPPRDNH